LELDQAARTAWIACRSTWVAARMAEKALKGSPRPETLANVLR
jgi:hypothetical protein